MLATHPLPHPQFCRTTSLQVMYFFSIYAHNSLCLRLPFFSIVVATTAHSLPLSQTPAPHPMGQYVLSVSHTPHLISLCSAGYTEKFVLWCYCLHGNGDDADPAGGEGGSHQSRSGHCYPSHGHCGFLTIVDPPLTAPPHPLSLFYYL